jgi:hypothetical protein
MHTNRFLYQLRPPARGCKRDNRNRRKLIRMLAQDDEHYSMVIDCKHLRKQRVPRKSDISTEILSVEGSSANHGVIASTVQQVLATWIYGDSGTQNNNVMNHHALEPHSRPLCSLQHRLNC